MYSKFIDKKLARGIALLMLAIGMCLAVAPAGATARPALRAASPNGLLTSAGAVSANPADPAELQGFLDDLIGRQLTENHIPGATVAVVQNGRLLFANGYGYANLERRTPVVADQTLFRVGSVSKLFTWTAVLQLVEQGKLDLDADVNTYLTEFQIPATYPAPITLAHLLTHTAGFEDRQLGITVASADKLVPLGSYLADTMPARVFAPGTVTAYSNYGNTLAGYIVERIAGQPFAQYVEQHIFAPLEMRHSTFAQQLPADLAAQLATSYDEYNASFHALPFEYFQSAPAGGLSATATDMAQFMIAQLQDGRLGDAQILQAATMQDMQRQHFTNHPHVNGMTYGFVEMTLNGQRLLVHSGTTNDELFRSLLVLLPAQNTGLFVSYNGMGGDGAKWALLQAFLDHYVPAGRPTALTPPADFAQRAGQFTGGYQPTRMAATTIEKIQALFAPAITVRASDDGYLTISGLSQKPTTWVETAPLEFKQVSGRETLAFRADEQGQITYLFKGNLPIYGFRKLAWYETLPVHYGVLAGCVVLFLSALLIWPIGWLVTRRKGAPASRGPSRARWLLWSISALNLLFLLLLVVSLQDLALFPTSLTKVALGLALAAAVLTVVAVAGMALAWRQRYWGIVGRTHYTLVTLSGLAFIGFLNYWNLLGFRW